MKSIWKNFFILLRGKGAAALLTLSATVLMARVLSVQDFGLVVLLHTYVIVVRGLFQFKPFEPIVRYGVPLLDAAERFKLASLLCLTRLVDVCTSVFAALVAFLLVPVAANYLGWDARLSEIALGYSLVLLVTGTGTAKGVLRLHNRFDALSLQLIIAPLIRFIGVAVLAFKGADRDSFILVWALALASGNVYLVLRGHMEMKKQFTSSIWKGQSLRSILTVPEDFWHFSLVVYGQTQVDLVGKHINTLLAGAMLGPAAAALFRVAKDFANVLATPAVLLRQVLFPDLTRAWHRGDASLKGNAYKVSLSAGVAGLVLVALSLPFGARVLGLIGSDYANASVLLSLLLMAATLDLTAAPLRTASYAMGRAGTVLNISLVCMVIYVGAFVGLTDVLDLEGAGLAGIIASGCVLLGILNVVRKNVQHPA